MVNFQLSQNIPIFIREYRAIYYSYMKLTFLTNHSEKLTFYSLAILLVVIKIISLTQFGFEYTGSDDQLFWQVALDYSNGIFREPFLYGQNYNYALESFMSVPLIKTGAPVHIALPIMSTFIGVFPFFLFAVVLFKKGFTVPAMFFLCIPITMPIEYDIITCITRGFTSGIFFCSFLVFPLLSPDSKKSWVISGVFVSVAYVFNPNSIVFSLPVCLYLLFKNYRQLSFYLILGIALIPALVIYYWSKKFYIDHPEYMVHGSWRLGYSFKRLVNAFTSLDKFFRYLTPAIWPGNWMVVVFILILGIGSIKRKWRKGLSITISIIFIFFLLGVNKISDDIGSIFLSSTRMFLAIPLLLGLALWWVIDTFRTSKKWQMVMLVATVMVFVVKVYSYPEVIKKHTEKTNLGPIAIKNIEELKKECSEINEMANRYRADLVVFTPTEAYNICTLGLYNNGCSAIQKNSFNSIMNIYERRTWVFEEEKNSARKNILLFNQDTTLMSDYQKAVDCEIVQNNPPVILIKNNNKNLMEIATIFRFDLKRNTY